MLRALLLLALALPAHSRELPASVDLSEQFPPGERRQHDLNSCHAFAAVGLLEAAIYRRAGGTLRLSDADLWVRQLVVRSHEGGLLLRDLRVGLRRGVTPGDWYQEMKARYKEGDKKKDLLPEVKTPEAKEARKAVRELLEGLEAQSVPSLPYSCMGRENRRDRIMELLADGLPVGVGVFLSRMSEPWKSKGKDDGLGGPHYVILKGYERTEKGVVFRVRNWWTGLDPDMHEDDLCALFATTWLQ